MCIVISQFLKKVMECSIGLLLKEDCHKLTFSRSSELIDQNNLNEHEKYLLTKRIQAVSFTDICTYHYKKYVTYYFSLFGKKCCDPSSAHKKPILKSLREITVEFCEANENLNLIPGRALCSRCMENLRKTETNENYDDITDILSRNFDDLGVSFDPKYEVLDSLNKICSIVEESPIPPIQKLSISKRKRKIDEKVDQISNKIRKKLEATFDVVEHENNKKDNDHICYNADYLELIDELKMKFKASTTFDEKYEILSLLPKKWTISKIQSEFECSEYLVKKAKTLRAQYGVLAKAPKKESGRQLKTEIVEAVIKFFEDDDISRLMPGQRDCVTVRDKNNGKSKEQKRLILFNLKEAYEKFKQIHPNLTIGFSSFASLRPKNCVLAGASGTHSVCVCLIHQNMKLMLMACKTKLTYKELLKKIVCNDSSEQCMLYSCKECPGTDVIDSDICNECELSSEINFKQWVSTDRCNLLTVVKNVDELKDDLKIQLTTLKPHHFISKKQSEYLRNLKENLKDNSECIALVDFSENYAFMVQDEVQSFHWTNNQATLHPFVIYFKEDGLHKTKTLCVISDYLTHNTVSFFAFQKIFLDYLKNSYPEFKKIYYFSDGAAAQYKNKKNCINICHHEADFGLKAEWHFFATSHGKSPCDGAGGTIKRTVRRASLQRTTDDHILTPIAMHDFCSNQISGIKFFFVSSQDVEAAETFLSERFININTIKNTRSYHSFIPISQNQLQARKYSASDNFDIVNIVKPNRKRLNKK